jgi:hypothetical protein
LRVEFLLEEASMANVLRELLPKILPEGYELDVNCFLRPHRGKTDLQKSLSKKMKVFSQFYEPVKIVILHDQNSSHCIELKNRLRLLCEQSGTCAFLIRIVCRELESWYLGDMDAIEKAYPSFKAGRYKRKSKFRNPDNLSASDELAKILPEFQKGLSSKRIAPFLSVERNSSRSFNNFVIGLRKFLNEPGLKIPGDQSPG